MFKQGEHDITGKEISSSIENGQYYNEAYNWYSDKFLRPINQRFYLLIILGFFSYLLFFLYVETTSWFPIKVNRPIVMVNDNIEYKQIITKLENKYNNVDYAILEKLITSYIKIREEFPKGKLGIYELDKRYQKVGNNSSRGVLKEYQSIFYPGNKDNPMERIGDNGKRIITIKQVDFDIKQKTFWADLLTIKKNIAIPQKAIIMYEVKEINSKNEVQYRELNNLYMSFNFGGIIYNKENEQYKLTEFMVTSYKSFKVDQQ